MKAYTEGSDNPEAALDSTEKILTKYKSWYSFRVRKLK
jgi:hypothetical protein